MKPLNERVHDMYLDEVLPLGAAGEPFEHPDLATVAARMRRARDLGASVMVIMGAHVIKMGLSRLVIDLMARGLVTHVGMNGAGPIHDYELALMGPEVYLKALAMARNVAHQQGRKINRFTTAVFDLLDLGPDLGHEAPKTDARYYYRPFKTILVRTVQDGGESFYIRGPHRGTLPALHRLLAD